MNGAKGVPYLRVTIRLPKAVVGQCEHLAMEFGWELADLLRTLICIGATFVFLTAKSPERHESAEKLLGGLEIVTLSRSFSLRLTKRNYAFRLWGHQSTLLSVSLPKSVCDLVGVYADLKKASRNQTYHKLLLQGLIAYFRAQASLLEP